MSAQLKIPLLDKLEFDSGWLSHGIGVLAEAKNVGRYQGEITSSRGASKTFTLTVVPPPAETQLTIDLSQNWTVSPGFSVGQNGHIVTSVTQGDDDFRLRIWNVSELLLSNTALQAGQLVMLRLFRPGKHIVTDVASAAACTVTVAYPDAKGPLKTDPVRIAIADGKMQPDAVGISALQPLLITAADQTHIVSELVEVSDRDAAGAVTSVAFRKKP
jgi:hypothetical protein